MRYRSLNKNGIIEIEGSFYRINQCVGSLLLDPVHECSEFSIGSSYGFEDADVHVKCVDVGCVFNEPLSYSEFNTNYKVVKR